VQYIREQELSYIHKQEPMDQSSIQAIRTGLSKASQQTAISGNREPILALWLCKTREARD